MKKLTAALVTMILLISTFTCYSLNDQISVYIEGTKVTFDKDAAPCIDDGRTLIPIRKVSESLNANVDWDAAERIVTINKDAKIIKLKIDDDKAIVNNEEKKLDVPAKIKGSRTYVPLRFVSECFGVYVTWDQKTRTVNLAWPSVSISFDKTKAKAGEIIKATINVNGFQNMAGYQYNLKYDPEVLEAVDPSTGETYADDTSPAEGTLLLNPSFNAMPMSANSIKDGILNTGRVYINLSAYKDSGKPESTGSIAVIGFKVLKETTTNIKFEDSDTMPNAISGVVLYDWDSVPSSNLKVIQPSAIN